MNRLLILFLALIPLGCLVKKSESPLRRVTTPKHKIEKSLESMGYTIVDADSIQTKEESKTWKTLLNSMEAEWESLQPRFEEAMDLFVRANYADKLTRYPDYTFGPFRIILGTGYGTENNRAYPELSFSTDSKDYASGGYYYDHRKNSSILIGRTLDLLIERIKSRTYNNTIFEGGTVSRDRANIREYNQKQSRRRDLRGTLTASKDNFNLLLASLKGLNLFPENFRSIKQIRLGSRSGSKGSFIYLDPRAPNFSFIIEKIINAKTEQDVYKLLENLGSL
jgi:hypothetical protein